jgi:AraC-like DNA-binding protein
MAQLAVQLAYLLIYVDKMTTTQRDISQLFRVPSPIERALGLWVDRVGRKRDQGLPERFRVLGLHGLVTVIEGSGVFHIEGQSPRSVSAGDVMLLFPGMPHRYGSPAGWVTRWIVFGGERARTLERIGLLDASSPVVRDQFGAVSAACDTLSALMARSDSSACLKRHNVVCDLVHALAESRDMVSAASRAEQLAQLISYLDEHFLEEVRPADLARRFALSYTHLRRLFRQTYGHGIKEYVTQKRLSLAKRLLSEKRYTLKQVAFMSGYSDPHYFMRLFKARVGSTAGRFE